MSLLVARGLTKSYGAARVLDQVDFDVAAGEVHALVGENGAGKSTLIKILGGAVRPDAGTAELAGQPLPLGDPLAIRNRGISIVYQEIALVPALTVADNIFLGREAGGALLDRVAMKTRATELLAELGLSLDPLMPVGQLSVAQQQLVEIARALLGDARIVILDEPTASLTPHDVDRLFAVVRRLRERGLGVVYISHRFEEIFALADRVTVLRDGRHVASAPASGVERAQLIRWMVGRDVSEEFPPHTTAPGPVVLEAEHVSAPPRFHDLSVTVRAGEIVGLAGLVGAGRTSAGLALVAAIPSGGRVRVGGKDVDRSSPGSALKQGIAYLTEDRKGRGLFPLMSAASNMTMARLGAWTRSGLLALARERDAASKAARDFDVRVASLDQPASTLSGGNQQKLLLARYLLAQPTALILDEPTRGVDVGARAEIYRLLRRLSAEGLAILMISSDLPELLGMSDRIVVMREGRVTGEVPRGASPDAVMSLATR